MRSVGRKMKTLLIRYKYMDDCVFCKIIKGEIPCYKVYENEKSLAFLDIKPTNSGHTLVIPKMHYKNLEEIPEEDLRDLAVVIKKIGKLLKDKLGVAGYNMVENNDPVAGQLIPHLHFHVIPRSEGDALRNWPGFDYKEGEAEEILKKLNS